MYSSVKTSSGTARALDLAPQHHRLVALVQRAVGLQRGRALDAAAEVLDVLEAQRLDQQAAGRVALDRDRQQRLLVDPHLEPVVGDFAGLRLERQQVGVLALRRLSTLYSVAVVDAQDVGVVEDAAGHRLQAGDPYRPAHVGDVQPHVVAEAQRGAAPCRSAGRGTAPRACRGPSSSCRARTPSCVPSGWMSISLRYDLVGLGLEVAVHLLQNLRAVDGAAAGSASRHTAGTSSFFMSGSAVRQTWPSASTGSMREAFHAGCRLASSATTTHHRGDRHDIDRADARRQHQALLLAEVEGDLPDVERVDQRRG